MRIYARVLCVISGALVSAPVLLCLTCLSYGDFRFVSCSVAFVSRHTNPFDNAQVIISSTVLTGLTFHHAAGGFLCVGCVWFLFFCLLLFLFCFLFFIRHRDGPIGPWFWSSNSTASFGSSSHQDGIISNYIN